MFLYIFYMAKYVLWLKTKRNMILWSKFFLNPEELNEKEISQNQNVKKAEEEFKKIYFKYW